MNRVHIGELVTLSTGGDWAQVETSDGVRDVDLAVIAEVAEWLAVAWENLSGKEYKPVLISERGYVMDPGVVTFGPESVRFLKEVLGTSIDITQNGTAK